MKTCKNIAQQIMLLFYGLLFFSSISCIFLFALTGNTDWILVASFSLWIANVLFCLKKVRERFLALLFHITIFTFILSRPVIDFCQKSDWMANTYSYSSFANPQLAMLIIFISLLGVWGGMHLAEILHAKREIVLKNEILNLEALGIVSSTIFLISFVFRSLEGIEILQFRLSHSYESYYILFQSRIPYVFHILGSFNKYSLCFFLASKPSKPKATLFLILYIVLTLPELILGSRGDFIIAILFALFYYVFRDYVGCKKKWVGKTEKLLLVAGIPTGVFFLGVYNYIREGSSIKSFNFLYVLKDFFYKQGVSFSWLSCGVGVCEQLPKHINYSFGGLIDYILYGKMGQLLFETQGIPSGNNVIRGTSGNNLAHHLSYIVLGKRYLQGHGTGSSYLMENYIDFGLLGVFLFGIFIGIIVILFMKLAKSYSIFSIILLLMFSGIIYMPRSEFCQIISFMIYIQFWLIFICCIIATMMLRRKFKRN